MSTIRIAPTWVWVAQMTLRLIDDGDQKKAEREFVKELCRLGPVMSGLVKKYRRRSNAALRRDFFRQAILDMAKEVDRTVEKEEE